MEYKDCKGFKNQYVAQRFTGNGVMEAKLEEKKSW